MLAQRYINKELSPESLYRDCRVAPGIAEDYNPCQNNWDEMTLLYCGGNGFSNENKNFQNSRPSFDC